MFLNFLIVAKVPITKSLSKNKRTIMVESEKDHTFLLETKIYLLFYVSFYYMQ